MTETILTAREKPRVDIRAVHDGTWAYFLFTWEDPTRSLKQLPLIKEVDGWHLLHNGFEAGDEHEFNEDKFSVLLTTVECDPCRRPDVSSPASIRLPTRLPP